MKKQVYWHDEYLEISLSKRPFGRFVNAKFKFKLRFIKVELQTTSLCQVSRYQFDNATAYLQKRDLKSSPNRVITHGTRDILNRSDHHYSSWPTPTENRMVSTCLNRDKWICPDLVRRKDKRDEKGNANQCFAAGRMPDRDC